MTITLYTKPNCVQCDATKRALDRADLTYVTVDLTDDTDALALFQQWGYRSAPVIVAGDDHWSGFRPDKISEIRQSA